MRVSKVGQIESPGFSAFSEELSQIVESLLITTDTYDVGTKLGQRANTRGAKSGGGTRDDDGFSVEALEWFPALGVSAN